MLQQHFKLMIQVNINITNNITLDSISLHYFRNLWVLISQCWLMKKVLKRFTTFLSVSVSFTIIVNVMTLSLNYYIDSFFNGTILKLKQSYSTLIAPSENFIK